MLGAVVSVRPCVAGERRGGGEGGFSIAAKVGGGEGDRGGDMVVWEEALVGSRREEAPREKVVRGDAIELTEEALREAA